MKLNDLVPRGDVMGGSLRTHTDRPAAPNGTTYVALRDYFTLWLERLEEFYDERFKSQEKAITKAEAAQASYNQGHNDLLRKMDEQHKETIPRIEYEAKQNGMQRELNELHREFREKREMDANRMQDSRQSRQGWIIPMIILAGIAFINLVINLGWLLKK